MTREVSGRVTLVRVGQPDRFVISKGNPLCMDIHKRQNKDIERNAKLVRFPFELV